MTSTTEEKNGFSILPVIIILLAVGLAVLGFKIMKPKKG
jgi:hypothetical protein